ncbi:DUF402 domain-containing protein [Spiroplasma endosymbiont of Ammophila pubescens]|uniref:DUF402 domain-containing protein n=1 Tax=Spiroplasma endosymbiont of Ammophila pubescens TaxID=3066315 RepID=UPI0032B2938E
MDSLQVGDSVLVHAYKHNGSVYRSWESAVVLLLEEEYIVLVNEDVTVTELNGRKWKTNEPAIWIFNRKNWSNIICMLKDTGINYYCNIASPFIMEQKTIKYIDYDLDIKVFADGSYKILDLKEFNRNRIAWKYSRDIVNTIWTEIDNLKHLIKNKLFIFKHSRVETLWKQYLVLKSKLLK